MFEITLNGMNLFN